MSNAANYSKAVVLVVIRIHFETFSGQRRTGERAPVGGYIDTAYAPLRRLSGLKNGKIHEVSQ